MKKEVWLAYGSVGAACLAFLIWTMQLWDADLTVLFDYERPDGLLTGLMAKGLSENWWCLHHPRLGAPGTLALYDFPPLSIVHLSMLKLLSFVTSDYAETVNLYFLLTFPLSALTALGVFRTFAVSLSSAVVGSVLFAFLPYHFWRGERHLIHAAYYLVPLTVMVLLWSCRGPVLLALSKEHPSRGRDWNYQWNKSVLCVVICILISASDIYYAFFTVFLLLIAGGIACVRWQSSRVGLSHALLIALIVATLAFVLTPSFMYVAQHGRNLQTAQRVPQEAEIYGLKIAQLFLPVTGHRLPTLAQIKERYNKAMPLVNENDSAALGIIGSSGLLFLFCCLLWRRLEGNTPPLLGHLSVLTLAAVLFATVGGFGSLFALFVATQLRGYNRISIYIAFFSLFAVVLLLDACKRRWATTPRRRYAWGGILLCLLLFGLWDQTTPAFAPPYARLRANYRSDAEFIGRIEATVPAHAMIFQLPYVPFPEHPPVHRMLDYDHARGYLHSKTLRWSYGAMKGREDDAWIKQVAGQPLAQMVMTLTAAGFSGIYVDRYGYADVGKALEAQLTQFLKTSPLVSANQRLLFFPLNPLPTAPLASAALSTR